MNEHPIRYLGHEEWCEWHFEQYPNECNCGETGPYNPPAYIVARNNPQVATQSRVDSFMEAITNTAIGFGVSLATWIIIAPWFGIELSWGGNLAITGIFTIVSIARGYLLRRAFNGRSVWSSIRSAFA